MAEPKRNGVAELAAQALDQDTRNLIALTGKPIRVPKYRFHKASGRAVIEYRPLWKDRTVYLTGPYGSPESIAHYRRCVARVVRHKVGAATPRPVAGRRKATVQKMLAAYRRFMTQHYGAGSREYNHFRGAMKLLRVRCGRRPVRKIGPLRLKRVREDMLKINGRFGKWSRTYINAQFKRLVAIFAWGVENEFVSAGQLAAIKTIKGLRKGKTSAPERAPVLPVAWAEASKLLSFLSPCLAAMVELQYLTGMRSDELTRLNIGQIDFRDSTAWQFRPWHHKTAHRDKLKIVCLGPRAQAILIPYLQGTGEFLFSPRVSMREIFTARRAASKTKQYGKRKRSRFNPNRYRPRYFTDSYYQALGHGFEKAAKANVALSAWNPHRLRHTRATETRASYGLEGSQIVLGNSRQAAEIYAEKSLPLAIKIAVETG